MISPDINKIIIKLILVVISQGLLLLDLLQNKKERLRKKIVFVWKFQKKKNPVFIWIRDKLWGVCGLSTMLCFLKQWSKTKLYCLATQAQAKLKMEKKRDNNWLGSHISSGEEVLRWIVIGRSELSLNNLRESLCSSNTEPSALTTELLDKAVALACLWYSWPHMLKVAPCTVVRSYSHTSKFFWLDGLLLFCIIMGLCSASSAIISWTIIFRLQN